MLRALFVAVALCALFCWSSAIPIRADDNKCCRVCSTKSIACGDVCIDKGATCHVKPGCACNHTSTSSFEEDLERNSNADVGCIDEDGNAVDWWMVYKMPQGYQYAYRDSTSRSESILSVTADKTLDCTTCGALGKTLHQIYANKGSLAYMLYNDEYPDSYPTPSNGTLMHGGHSKGVLASNQNTGFWLIHSVPKFPDLTAASFTWTASHEFGQSFLCLSVQASDIENIAKNLQYSYVHTYTWNIPSSLKAQFPNMQDTADGKGIDGTGVISFSIRGTTFKSYSKSPSWNNDLYEFLVQPDLNIAKGMYWETWRRSPFEDKFCKGSKFKYSSMNVESMKLDGFDEFKYTMDHAKWGISAESTSPWVCIGDINRMQSQFARGGQTTCFQNVHLWTGFHEAMNLVDSC